MRVACTILLLLPLALGANVPKGSDRLQGSKFRVQGSNSPSLSPATLPPDTSHHSPAPVADSWAPPAFARYDGILSRMPFGQSPVVAAPSAAAAAAAPAPPPAFATKLTLCAINRTPNGALTVGFVDGSINPAASYYLGVGEDQNGFTVVSADIDQEMATISKDGTSIDLKMGKGPTVASAKPTPVAAVAVDTPATPSPVVAAPTPPTPVIRSPFGPATWPIPGNIKAIDAALNMGITNDSYVERLKKRRMEVLAQQTAADADAQATIDKAAEEKAAAAFETILRQRNLALIRKGDPGLGFPLTPEEDAKLVGEGILPQQK